MTFIRKILFWLRGYRRISPKHTPKIERKKHDVQDNGMEQ